MSTSYGMSPVVTMAKHVTVSLLNGIISSCFDCH